ncbi:MAG: ATP-dependent Clp protease proteolytic subunit [Clostridia bacterium]|nr:ATP-dependent Clp protease proteolytic subunit [Clostridia bacterium]
MNEETKTQEEECDGAENSEARKTVEKLGAVTDKRFACITIIGQVEGHYILDSSQKATKYEHLIPLLVSVEQDAEIEGVLVVLNTMGGDVEAGLAIAEMIASLTKPTVSLVLGGGHSIGIPLAVCADRSFIVESATMTIHPVRSSGTVIGVPQSFYYFERMQERILDFLASHSKADKAELRRMMMNTDEMANDVGSIIDGRLAVGIGLIDEIGGIGEALECLRKMAQDDKKRTKSE